MVLERKLQRRGFLKGIKRQFRFIDRFLKEQSVSIARFNSFSLNRAHQNYIVHDSCYAAHMVLLHNGGFYNGCITKRILLLQAFHS
jgi:hypothetical protein